MATGDIDPEATIQLVSNDGEQFSVQFGAIQLCRMLKNMFEDCGVDPDGKDEEPVPLPSVNSAILKKVIAWCEHHRADPPAQDENVSDGGQNLTHIDAWDQEFLKVDHETLFGLMRAANCLDIKGLMNAACKTAANMMQGMSVQEVHDTFNIVEEEKEEIWKKND